jgi:hypothetical protein
VRLDGQKAGTGSFTGLFRRQGETRLRSQQARLLPVSQRREGAIRRYSLAVCPYFSQRPRDLGKAQWVMKMGPVLGQHR